jgi:hypothetical protein
LRYLFKYHATKTLRRRWRGRVESVLGVGPKRRLAVSFVEPYTPENKAPIPHYIRLAGPQILSTSFGNRRTFCSFGNRRFLCSPACQMATVLTELTGFSSKNPRHSIPSSSVFMLAASDLLFHPCITYPSVQY